MLEPPPTQVQELLEMAGYTTEPDGKPLYFYVGALLENLRLLWSKRRFIGRAMLITGIASGILVMLLPKRYQAVAYLMPPDSSGGMPGLSLLMGMRGGDTGGAIGSQIGSMLGMSSPAQLYVRALQSNRVEDRIIERFDLTRLYG